MPPTAFIMGWIAGLGDAGADALGRCVGISRLAFCTACGQPRKIVPQLVRREVSGASHVPASRPTTRVRPARAEARPRRRPRRGPTMTTSVFGKSIAMGPFLVHMSSRLARAGAFSKTSRGRRPTGGLARARAQPLVVWRHRESHARVADQIPADKIRVAAVVGIAEGALDRVRSNEIEERRGSGTKPGATFVSIAATLILIGCRQRCEPRPFRGSRMRVQAGQAAAIGVARRGESAAKGAVDVVRRPRLAGAGAVLIGRDEAGGDGLERFGLGRGQGLERLCSRRRGWRLLPLHSARRDRSRGRRRAGPLQQIAPGDVSHDRTSHSICRELQRPPLPRRGGQAHAAA